MQVVLPKAASGVMRRLEDGPWAGWSTWTNDPFSIEAGPSHVRWDEAGAVTVSFSGDFLGSARPGALVECRGEIVKAGRSMVFVRGLIKSDADPIMSFQAMMKKTRMPGGVA